MSSADREPVMLFVTDHRTTAAFYASVLGFEVEAVMRSSAFLRNGETSGPHALSLFGVAAQAPPARIIEGTAVWRVSPETIDDLRTNLATANALVGETQTADSTVLRGVDPDGIEFSVVCHRS